MIRRSDSEGTDGYVLLVYAHDHAEAEFYKSLLLDHDIEAVVNEDAEALGKAMRGRVPVLVPEELVAEAKEVIEQRVEMDDEFEDFEDEDDDFDSEDDIEGLGEIDPEHDEVEVFDGDDDADDEELF